MGRKVVDPLRLPFRRGRKCTQAIRQVARGEKPFAELGEALRSTPCGGQGCVQCAEAALRLADHLGFEHGPSSGLTVARWAAAYVAGIDWRDVVDLEIDVLWMMAYGKLPAKRRQMLPVAAGLTRAVRQAALDKEYRSLAERIEQACREQRFIPQEWMSELAGLRALPAATQTSATSDTTKWNRYALVSNNPLSFVDPDGNERAQILLDQRNMRLLRGEITPQEFKAQNDAAGMGALAGGAIVGGLAYGSPLLG